MVPYRDNGAVRAGEQLYNKVHASLRSVVERAFGRWKHRFQRLDDLDVHDEADATRIILALAVLHNYCERDGDVWDDPPPPARRPARALDAGDLENVMVAADEHAVREKLVMLM